MAVRSTLTYVTGNLRKLEEVCAILGESLPWKVESKKIDLPELQGEPDDIVREKCLLAVEKGRIVPARGQHYFGWDPIFQPEGFEETYAELKPAVKNSISHRARALQALREYLEVEHLREEQPKIKRPKFQES